MDSEPGGKSGNLWGQVPAYFYRVWGTDRLCWVGPMKMLRRDNSAEPSYSLGGAFVRPWLRVFANACEYMGTCLQGSVRADTEGRG